VEHRDRVLALAAPFAGEPAEIARTAQRYGGIQWGERLALISDYERTARRERT